MRSERTEWFTNRDPTLPELRELLKIGTFLPLQQRDLKGRLVIIIRTGAHNPRKHKQNDVFKIGKMILDIAVNEMEYASIYGVVAIFDMKDVTFFHALQLSPSLIKRAVFAWQNYHVKPKALTFINAPIHVNVVLNVFKQFMKPKMKNRVNIYHSDFDEIYEDIPRSILPKELGGTDGDYKQLAKYWEDKCISYKDWYAVDEKFRPTNLEN